MRPAVVILAILLWVGSAMADGGTTSPQPAEQPSKEDLKIIAMMEMLQLMEMLKNIDIIKDMDVLIEENKNENQD